MTDQPSNEQRTRDAGSHLRLIGLAVVLAGMMVIGGLVWFRLAGEGDRKPNPGEISVVDHTARQVEKTGASEGEAAPAPTVFKTNGEPVPLSEVWRDKPALIVTASTTCAIANNHLGGVQWVQSQVGQAANVVVLYTIEAHPKDSPSPYEAWNWVAGVAETGPLQPATLSQRLKLAEDYAGRLRETRLLVDNMKNQAWSGLGGGPNMAVLIDDGRIVAKHPWFNPQQVAREIQRLSDGDSPS